MVPFPLSLTCIVVISLLRIHQAASFGQSLSAFIDLYHKYNSQAGRNSGEGPTSDSLYFWQILKQDDCVCVCVLESDYLCPLRPLQFTRDPLPQSSPLVSLHWVPLPGIPLNLTSIHPSPSHPSRFGSKAASSKKFFTPLHHHHHSLAFILYHLLSLVRPFIRNTNDLCTESLSSRDWEPKDVSTGLDTQL